MRGLDTPRVAMNAISGGDSCRVVRRRAPRRARSTRSGDPGRCSGFCPRWPGRAAGGAVGWPARAPGRAADAGAGLSGRLTWPPGHAPGRAGGRRARGRPGRSLRRPGRHAPGGGANPRTRICAGVLGWGGVAALGTRRPMPCAAQERASAPWRAWGGRGQAARAARPACGRCGPVCGLRPPARARRRRHRGATGAPTWPGVRATPARLGCASGPASSVR